MRSKQLANLWAVLLSLLALTLLTACGPAGETTEDTSGRGARTTDMPTLIPDDAPTDTPPPTLTMTPTPTITPTPTPLIAPVEPISIENVMGVEELLSLGKSELLGIAWAPDGTYLAVGTGSGIFLYDGETLDKMGFFDVGYASAMAFSPDGKMLASGFNENITLWDTATGELLKTIPFVREQIQGLTYSADGQTLVAASTHRRVPNDAFSPVLAYVDRFNTSTGSHISTLSMKDPEGEPFFFPRITHGGDYTLNIAFEKSYTYDARTGRLLHELPPEFRAHLGSDLMASIGEAGVEIWDIATNELINILNISGVVSNLAFDETGETLFTQSGSTLTLWDPRTGEVLKEHTWANKPLGQLVVNPTFTKVAVVGEEQVSLLNMEDGELIGEVSGFYARSEAFALSPDGMSVAFSSGHSSWNSVYLGTWDLNTGERSIFGGKPMQSLTGVGFMTFLPDGQLLTNEYEESHLLLWDVHSGEQQQVFKLDGEPYTFTLSPDGGILATGHYQFVELWDRSTGSSLSSIGFFPSSILDLAFSADGDMLAFAASGMVAFGGYEDFAVLWDVANDQELQAHHLFGENNHIGDVAISPDGEIFAYSVGQTILLRDVIAASSLGRLVGHEGRIVDFTFSPDGRLIISIGEDNTLRFWDVQATKLLHTIDVLADGMALTPTGDMIILVSGGTLRIWGVPSP
jgi:WD40 repeat protein